MGYFIFIKNIDAQGCSEETERRRRRILETYQSETMRIFILVTIYAYVEKEEWYTSPGERK